MKLFRSPAFVGLLGVLAVIMVVNSLRPLFSRSRRAPPAPAPIAAPVPVPVAPAVSAAPVSAVAAAPAPVTSAAAASHSAMAPGAPGQSNIDVETVRRDSPRWALGRRDPFQVRATPARPIYPRAMELLTLSAIWRQTDSSLAVLNSQIYMAGDTVLRFMIKSIESDRVLVQGPNGNEVVEFKTSGGTNALPVDAVIANASVPVPRPTP
jgi:hypothetical protein